MSSTKGQQRKKPKKKGGTTTAFIDDFIELGVNCKFITAAGPLIAEAISKTQGDLQSVDEV